MQTLKLKFIEPEKNPPEKKKRAPASYIRKSFCVNGDVKNAELYITALGVYIGYLNGERLDNQVLLPGYTDYKHRVQYQSYDITDKLRQGENVIGAVVGDGWYRGSVGIGSKINCYGTKTKFACRLEITYADGRKDTIDSDDSFRVTQNGALRENDLKIREVYDATKELSGWNNIGFDDSAWGCAVSAEYNGEVVSSDGEKVIEHECFTPDVLHTPDGSAVLDFKQNMAGYVEFTVTGKKGHTVKLTMGEVLDENGNFTMKNLSAEGAALISGEVGQELIYTLKDGTQTYKPHFHVCGFRYVKLENWPEEVKSESFKAHAVYSDLEFTGKFTCSNELINKLVNNVRWSQKSNFVDIPGDCPTRERAGWTGDISVFAETACYLSDPRKFLKKWFKDYMLEQWEDGSLPYVVPDGGYDKRQRSCLAWSNAIANITMIMYDFYGDKTLIEDVYDCVKRFVEYNIERAKKKNPFFLFKTGEHRKYIVETGFHYGEWLEPTRPMYKDFIKDLFYPDTEVTTAWFYKTAEQLSKMADILGKTEDKAKYGNLAENIKKAYHKEFLKNGKVVSDRQCRFVRPIFMGLIDGEIKAETAEALNKMCISNDYKIGTGFHTTYKILSVLHECGYTDTAFKMLENTKQPSWLYEVTKGATTTWENWNGIDEKGKPTDSQNHYAPGAVTAWLFNTVAGIRPLKPGFEEILIKPVYGGSLTFAECEYKSVKGLIKVRWDLKDGKFTVKVTTPVNGKLIMPDGAQYELEIGNHEFTCKEK